MAEEKLCYIHNTPTRLSCSACDKPICPKCAVEAAVGYRCQDCGKRNLSHIETADTNKIIIASLLSIASGTAAGFIWNLLSNFGLFISLGVAYIVGFIIAKTITKILGNKIGIKFQILAGVIALISIGFNPILITPYVISGEPITAILISLITYNIFNIQRLLSLIICIWASVRHFKF